MALNETTEKKIYLQIFKGKVTKRVDDKTEGAVQRELKDGKLIFEKHYESVSGTLRSISVKTTPYQGIDIKTLEIALDDVGELYNLSFNYVSSVCKDFLTRIENCDISQAIEFHPYYFEDKKKTVLVLYQNGKKIEKKYNRETPNGMPEMVQIKVKGQLVWDDSDQMEFLDKILTEKIIPKLGGKALSKVKQDIGDEIPLPTDPGDDEMGLPF